MATGLTAHHKLAGLAVLSGWFPIREKLKEVRMGVPFQRPRDLTRLW